ncbi:NotI family restriction endonuclease [Phocaeicola plebeius]|uniref:NotI family restriction endonuclease n=1 Tax=Phocaeicola plebeius TaxID=310297 RepID=UPI0026EB117D|nr:NotI family restriction endonuclease [Phocaeicola plebeius]
MKNNPLSEVFGFPIENESQKANRYRINKLCPFGNIVPNCTKDKASDPLGVCSINHGENHIITCPVRFREDWLIIEEAAKFAFPKEALWTSLSEIKLVDKNGQSAGNIDYVIVQYDNQGKIVDFASIEVQGVYITGNLRNAFIEYIKNPSANFLWESKNYPHPDYLSSSRKRLIPQMLSKGGIFKAWGKKQCVVLQKSFFDTLPTLPVVDPEEADIAWFLYDLMLGEDGMFHLTLVDVVYTEFDAALNAVIIPKPSDISMFIDVLQAKLDDKLSSSPDTPKTILNDL